MAPLLLWLVSCCVGASEAYTEIKKVAEEKVTLPCHHQLGLQEKGALDIEWLLTDSKGNQKAKERKGEKHRSVASCTRPNRGSNIKPRSCLDGAWNVQPLGVLAAAPNR